MTGRALGASPEPQKRACKWNGGGECALHRTPPRFVTVAQEASAAMPMARSLFQARMRLRNPTELFALSRWAGGFSDGSVK